MTLCYSYKYYYFYESIFYMFYFITIIDNKIKLNEIAYKYIVMYWLKIYTFEDLTFIVPEMTPV